MIKHLLLILIVFSVLTNSFGQSLKTENIIVVTMDGVRWQEIFGGADSALIYENKYLAGELKPALDSFWAPTPKERREKLLPFFWNVIGKSGQLYGNRNLGNKVSNANPYRFSYPGYNEIFTGYPDTLVDSNDKILNNNTNVLEFLQKQPKFKDKVAAFTSWDVFDAILNEKRSGVYVSSGFDPIPDAKRLTPELNLLNDMQLLSPAPLGAGVRPDFLTFFLGKSYLQKFRPKVLYLAFDETDDYAHGGKYDYYLNGAHQIDKWLGNLWSYIQSLPQYKDKTTLLILTDHGRGDETKSNWQNHGSKIPDADQIWLAAMGPDTKAEGEIGKEMQLYQAQMAATIAKLLGVTFTAEHPVAEPIKSIYSK